MHPCVTPKQSANKPDFGATPRTAPMGPPMNLAARLGEKIRPCAKIESKPESTYPKFTHSASSNSIGLKRSA